MIPDEVKSDVVTIARHAMEVARSTINVAKGNALVLTVPLVDIQVPNDIADLVLSVAAATGFDTSYSEDGLVLSWTNANITKIRSPDITLADIHDVLKEILALQFAAARKGSKWNRSEIIAILSLLLAIIVAVLGHTKFNVNVPSIEGRSSPSTQSHPGLVPNPTPFPKAPHCVGPTPR